MIETTIHFDDTADAWRQNLERKKHVKTQNSNVYIGNVSKVFWWKSFRHWRECSNRHASPSACVTTCVAPSLSVAVLTYSSSQAFSLHSHPHPSFSLSNANVSHTVGANYLTHSSLAQPFRWAGLLIFGKTVVTLCPCDPLSIFVVLLFYWFVVDLLLTCYFVVSAAKRMADRIEPFWIYLIFGLAVAILLWLLVISIFLYRLLKKLNKLTRCQKTCGMYAPLYLCYSKT